MAQGGTDGGQRCPWKRGGSRMAKQMGSCEGASSMPARASARQTIEDTVFESVNCRCGASEHRKTSSIGTSGRRRSDTSTAHRQHLAAEAGSSCRPLPQPADGSVCDECIHRYGFMMASPAPDRRTRTARWRGCDTGCRRCDGKSGQHHLGGRRNLWEDSNVSSERPRHGLIQRRQAITSNPQKAQI